MRFFVIEDYNEYREILVKTLLDLGHDAQYATFPKGDDRLQEIANQCVDFNPDFIFIDEELWYGLRGESVATKLSFGREKFIGISSGCKQKYCAKTFLYKDSLHLPRVKVTFTELIKTLK